MAKATFLELCQTTRQECRIPGTGPTAVTSQTGQLLRVVDFVALAAYQIENLWRDWKFLWSQYSTSTIADTSGYAGPGDLGTWDVDSFYLNKTLATNQHLIKMDYKEWSTGVGVGVQATGKPSNVIVKPDNSLVLYQTPDAVYTLTADYYKAPTKLAANTDTSNIPEQFERIIIAQAKMLYAGENGAVAMLQTAANEYQRLLEQLQSDQLPGQLGHTHAEASEMTVRPQ